MSEKEVGSLVKWFSEIGEKDSWLVSEKGANLGELHRKRISVPAGFVLTKNVFNLFIEENGLKKRIDEILQKTDFHDEEKLAESSEKIMNLIENSGVSEKLQEEIFDAYDVLDVDKRQIENAEIGALDILRSSHESPFVSVRRASNSGKSFLNVKGNEQLIESVKRVFASFFGADSLKKTMGKYPEEVSVIVQRMIDSEKSGVIVSESLQGKNGSVNVKAIFGLGNGLEREEIKTDRYRINKDLEITGRNINEKGFAVVRNSSGKTELVKLTDEKSGQEVLTGHELKILAQIGIDIEKHFGSAQEIGFAISNGNYYVLGTMPSEEISEEKEKPVPEVRRKKDDSKIKPVLKTKTKIMAVVDFPGVFEKTGIDSAVVKLEEIISSNGKHPVWYLKNDKIDKYVELLYSGLKKIVSPFKEAWIRISKVRSDSENLEGLDKKEKNPFLGYHGVRFGLKNADVMAAEFKAVKELADEFPEKKFGVMATHLSSLDEWKKFRKIFSEIGFPENVKSGFVIETPASVQIINSLCEEGTDFVNVSIEELAQHVLAVDKEDADLTEFYDEMNPAVLKSLSYVLRRCKNYGVRSSAFSDRLNREMAEFLFFKGVESIGTGIESSREVSEIIAEKENSERTGEKESAEKDEEEIILKALEDKDSFSFEEYHGGRIREVFEEEYRPSIRENYVVPSLNDAIPVDSEHFKEEKEQESFEIKKENSGEVNSENNESSEEGKEEYLDIF